MRENFEDEVALHLVFGSSKTFTQTKKMRPLYITDVKKLAHSTSKTLPWPKLSFHFKNLVKKIKLGS